MPSCCRALGDLRVAAAGRADPGQIAFDVGHEHRHADSRELLGERLQRDGFAGARGAGDQAVSIRERRQQRQLGRSRSSQPEVDRSCRTLDARRAALCRARGSRLGIYNTPRTTVAYAAHARHRRSGGLVAMATTMTQRLPKPRLADRMDRGRRARHVRARGHRVESRREHRRDVVHRRGRLRLRARLSLLQRVSRREGIRARSDARDAGRALQRRPRLHADEPLDRLRPSLRRHRGPGPADRPDARGAIRLSCPARSGS